MAGKAYVTFCYDNVWSASTVKSYFLSDSVLKYWWTLAHAKKILSPSLSPLSQIQSVGCEYR